MLGSAPHPQRHLAAQHPTSSLASLICRLPELVAAPEPHAASGISSCQVSYASHPLVCGAAAAIGNLAQLAKLPGPSPCS